MNASQVAPQSAHSRAVAATALPVLPTATPAPPTVVPTTVPSRTPPAPTHTPTPALVVSTAVPATHQPVPETIDPTLAAELQQILDGLVADGYIPGAVLSVHIPGYQPWTGASGYTDQQRTKPMRLGTHVRIASISKVFTAVVVLQLVEEGLLDLDVPVSTWYPQLIPHSDVITVRNLLNHTSGLYDYLEDHRMLSRAFKAPDYHWTPDELVAHVALQPPVFLPGTPDAWDYSSTNYVLLGMIVEGVTGRPLAQEMRERIFEPLDLANTYFAPDEPVAGETARGYRNSHDYTGISLSFAYATANLVSTTSDVQRFGEALFGGRLLRPETTEAMFIFENGKGQYNMPALEYGLGVMRNQLPVGPDVYGRARPRAAATVIGHTGGFGGFRSALWYAPESGITIALGMNQGGTDPNILATQVFDTILRSQGR
jgi:D-alanyl-D-alanine carboxypeptidase